MMLVERHIVKKNKQIDELCFLSKNLYNYCNYLLRQEFFKNKTLPKEYNLTKQLASENQSDYRALPSQSSQQVVKLLFKNWKSYFKLLQSFKKNPNKFNGKPRLPNYKHKVKGRNIVVFTDQQCKLKDGFIYFPKKVLKPQKTNVNNLKQVRLVPQCGCYVIEIIYEKEIKHVTLNKNKYLGIDLGINNLVTMSDNSGCTQPIIINGKIVKSINQFYNKKKAELQANLSGNQKTSRRIQHLTFTRNCKINDLLHKTSRFVVDYCVKHRIANIIIGYNVSWKQNVDIGKRNNQKFCCIPHKTLINQIKYKAELMGINLQLNEESYTSKIDALACEPLKKQKKYLGRRIKRGLFKSSTKCLVNADVNGSLNIMRKVIGDDFLGNLVNKSCVLQPVRIYPNKESLRLIKC